MPWFVIAAVTVIGYLLSSSKKEEVSTTPNRGWGYVHDPQYNLYNT